MSFPVLGLSLEGGLGLRRVPRGTLVCKPTSPSDSRAPQHGSSALGPVLPLSAARPKAGKGDVRSEPRIRGGGRRLRPHRTPERPEPRDKEHTTRFPEGRNLHEGGDRFVPPRTPPRCRRRPRGFWPGPEARGFPSGHCVHFPRRAGPAGTPRRPGPGQSPTRGSTWARAGAGRSGRGEERGRGGAARPGPPARRPQLPGSAAAPPRPPAGQSRASAARAHEPRRHQAERDPTARAWHRARTRTARAGQSAAGHAQPAGSLARGPHA